MDEYISKQTVLDYLNGYLHSIGEYNLLLDIGQRRALTNAIQDISAIKAADVQPVKWISVNDMLPDENQKCLVYRDINADLKITTGIWHSDTKEFYGLRHGTRLEDTIAWMPLLEPPKDGDNNA